MFLSSNRRNKISALLVFFSILILILPACSTKSDFARVNYEPPPLIGIRQVFVTGLKKGLVNNKTLVKKSKVSIDFARYKGRVVLLWFWAPRGKVEGDLNNLREFYEKYHSKGLDIFVISMQERGRDRGGLQGEATLKNSLYESAGGDWPITKREPGSVYYTAHYPFKIFVDNPQRTNCMNYLNASSRRSDMLSEIQKAKKTPYAVSRQNYKFWGNKAFLIGKDGLVKIIAAELTPFNFSSSIQDANGGMKGSGGKGSSDSYDLFKDGNAIGAQDQGGPATRHFGSDGNSIEDFIKRELKE